MTRPRGILSKHRQMDRKGSGRPLVGESDDMTGKHRDGEQIPLERARFSERKGNVMRSVHFRR